MKHYYGCHRDIKDARDMMFAPRYIPVPEAVDLNENCPPIMDQGELGSCTAHGITGALRYCHIANHGKDFEMSRLQLYYDERWKIHSTQYDSGAQIRTGIKCAAHNGVGHENLWPYDINKFKDRPAEIVYKDALQYQALDYERVTVSNELLKQALARKFPVIIGVTLYSSFESDEVARSGIVPMPDLETESIVGGHCMYCTGYEHGHYIVRNSWSEQWGDQGLAYFPESYLGSQLYGSDYWIITKAENERLTA